MLEMIRYSIVEPKNKREIVLLKGYPCVWGKCAFCDYISDNLNDEKEIISFNQEILQNVTGKFGVLEVINSGSVFELPKQTLEQIKQIVKEKNIQKLFFESYWGYRNKLQEIRNFFQTPIIFKCGIETFDHDFRNKVLNKGVVFSDYKEVRKYFESICIMVGIQGQTKEMIKKDVDILLNYFEYGCVNVYVNNTTNIKADANLIEWFYKEYGFLNENPSIEVLWNNTDFGVGGIIHE